MSYPIYYVEENDTLPILFSSFDGGTGASITLTGLAVTDIEIYKDGSATQRASDAGYTLLDTDGIDFSSITGIHGFSIDLSDNTDAGFYAVGSWYHVVVSSVTVDAQTVNFIACAFRIVSATRGMSGTALPAVAAGSNGGIPLVGSQIPNANADAAGGLPISDAGGLDLDTLNSNVTAILVDTSDMQPKLGTISDLGTGATIGANLVDIDTTTTSTNSDTNAILADTNELQTDWADGGRLDLLLDSASSAGDPWTTDLPGSYTGTQAGKILADILVDTGTTLDGKIDTIDGIVDAILLDTAEIGAAGAGLTEAGGTGDQLAAIPWNTAWAAPVNAEVDTALADIHLDHLLATDYDPASKPGTATALLNELIESDAGVSRFTANALEQAPSGGGTVDANIVSILGTAVTETSAGYLAAAFSYFFDVASPAKTINDVGVAGAGLSAQDVRDAMKLAPTAGTPAAGSLDAHLDDILDDTGTSGVVVSSGSKTGYSLASTGLDLVTAWTTNITGNLSGSVGSISGVTFPTNFGDLAITVTTGRVTVGTNSDKTGYSISGTITTLDALDTAQDSQHSTTQAAIAALNDLSAAQVNAEVLDVLTTDTFAESSGVPASTTTIVDKIGVLYDALINQVDVTALKKTFYDAAGTAQWEKDLTEDGSTYSESKGNTV